MTVIIIILVWLLLAAFNMYKLYTSKSGSNLIESVAAILLAPFYTLMAFVVIFLIKKW